MGRGLQAAPGLVCFDLDGTLYHDDRIYLRMIDYYFAGTPWEKETGSVKAEMSRVLAGGNPAFRCGRFAPKEWGVCPGPAAALLAVPTEAALLRPDPSPWLDRRCWSYISDGWSLAMYLARRIGWDGEAFWERFQLARRERGHLSRDSDSRLLSFLVSWYEANAGGGTACIPMTRPAIGDETGVCSRTVNRGVRALRERGFLDIQSGKIQLSHTQYLRLRAELERHLADGRAIH